MMAWTHAAIGAAIGPLAPDDASAFTVGAISHGAADLIPHRDFGMNVELPLLAVIMAYIAWRYGVRSKQFWGAVGGFSPDIENGLVLLGVLPRAIYPTHTKKAWYIGHGRKVRSIVPQIILIAICLCVAELDKPD